MCDIVPLNRYFVPQVLLAAILLGLGPTLAQAQLRPEAVPGGVAEIAVAAAGAPRPEVRFGGRPVLLQQRKTGWYALVGLSLDTPVGEQKLDIGPDGSRRQLPFQVAAKDYPVQKLKIANQKMVTPDPEQLARINAERDRQISIRSQFREVPVTRSDLALPADGRLSSRFGLRRVFNGEPRAPHTGLDVAVPTGTPIRAPADGVVTLVDDFYFNGKTVFVDHGQSFVSMVCHLDRAGVEAGQTVRRGEVLGHSGSSGRATGPHLHWSVYLNGAAVDPALFIGPRPAR
ncbi:MAG: peptidoglycan DD-metalloendopeptidase family protein [Zoogloea sp.]|jgi:murein DD-endopeptidase MepM/ murein hydrolase activator NlpD|nr:peptidoglycan DD-metalloendopeptidase family protein [Zoogloea sp.]